MIPLTIAFLLYNLSPFDIITRLSGQERLYTLIVEVDFCLNEDNLEIALSTVKYTSNGFNVTSYLDSDYIILS